jgi:hypothetical protein
MVISFSCYHHRCSRFLGFSGCITTRGTRSEYTKHPHIIHVYCTIRPYGCLCGCFILLNCLECTSWQQVPANSIGTSRQKVLEILRLIPHLYVGCIQATLICALMTNDLLAGKRQAYPNHISKPMCVCSFVIYLKS